MRRSAALTALLMIGIAWILVSREPQQDPRMKHAFRRPQQNGWIFVHLEGAPSEIGFQHGYLLAPEISEAEKVLALELTHDHKRDWQFFRHEAKDGLWPHIETQYQEELQGITEGLNARGVKLDLWDVVAMNANLELPYFVKWYDKQHGGPKSSTVAEHCSAFVATGSYTKDGRIVMAHNAWTNYLDGERWTIIFDIVPASGSHIFMDGFPGLIHSADDFGMNSAGIMITETTISEFFGWDPNGIPEFVRARKAMQYASSIDDFVNIMTEGNNGGYANNWLVGDRKTNEIADLELGLKNVTLHRSRDGYFAGSNFPVSHKLAREETEFALDDKGASANARRVRWDQLMAEYKGKIDVALAHQFLADHYDTYAGKNAPSERTLCGHIDLSSRGVKNWQPPYGAAGAVQNKAADASMAERLSFTASAGHACGLTFRAAEHISRHPEFSWQKPYLRDMNARPWTAFSAAQ